MDVADALIITIIIAISISAYAYSTYYVRKEVRPLARIENGCMVLEVKQYHVLLYDEDGKSQIELECYDTSMTMEKARRIVRKGTGLVRIPKTWRVEYWEAGAETRTINLENLYWEGN